MDLAAQAKKQQAIQYLTDLMATVTNYYLKGRIKPEPLRIRESRRTPGEVGIDLYNFGTKPVCEGLERQPVRFDDGSEEQGDVFAMHYNADDESPLTFLVDFENLPEVQVNPEDLPTDTLENVAKWLEQAVQPKHDTNDVTSFFYYMWNKWSEEECKRVFKADYWPHFWNKWCEAYDTMKGPRGAAELFYMMLSDTNRDKLVARALELYDGMTEK